MSKNSIIEKIQQLKDLIDTITQSKNNTSSVWDLIKEIQGDFKNVTLERDEQQDLWQNFQERITELKYKQEDIRNQNEEFVQEILQKLEVIDYQVSEILLNDDLSKTDIEEAKKPLSAFREELKKPFYPSKDAREAVWKIYTDINKRIKERENVYYENIRKERDKQFENSEKLTENILGLMNGCHPEPTPETMNKLLVSIQNLTTSGYTIDAKSLYDIKDNQTALKIKSEGLRTIKQFVRSHHDDLTREHKNVIYDTFTALYAALDVAWEAYKKSRNDKQENWKKKQIDFIARLELRISDQKEYKKKLEARIENQKDYVKRLHSRLNNQKKYIDKLKNDIFKQELFIGRQEKHLDSLEDKYHTALSDNFKEKVEQWMDEAEDKIESAEDSIVAKKDKIKEVENSIIEIDEKIVEVKNGIDEIPKQIKNVDKSIIEIQATIQDVLSKLEA